MHCLRDSHGRPEQSARHKSCRVDGIDADPAEVALLRLVAGMRAGAGMREFRAGIEAGQRMLGNRAFLRWVGTLDAGEQVDAGVSQSVCNPVRSAAAAPVADCGLLQLMPKKKKQQPAPAPEKRQPEPVPEKRQALRKQGAGGAGTVPEPGEKASSYGTQEPARAGMTEAQAVAAPEGRKKKKSRVQVALNSLRGEGVPAFADYIEAEIGEAALLHTLAERVNRAQDLGGVRAEALTVLEARLRLLDPSLAAPASTEQGREAGDGEEPETAVIAPLKSELTRRERELYEACARDNAGRLRYLLRHGNVDVNMGSKFGTLLSLAAYLGHTVIVRDLLAVPDIDINLAESKGLTPLYNAAQARRAKVVEMLLAAPGINPNLAATAGETPLHTAALHGCAEVVKLLLAAPGINVNPIKPGENFTPLHLAVHKGHENIIRLLLAAPGINIHMRTREGASALYIAVQLGFPGITEQLARRGADTNQALPSGTTPLYSAVVSERIEVVRILLQAPATRVDQATGKGIVPLAMAISCGRKDIARLLLRRGADPNVTGPAGLTPVHIACLYGHTAIVQMLLHSGADVDLELRDPDREGPAQSPHDLAALGDHREVMAVLAAHRRRREAALPRLERLPARDTPAEETGTPPPLSGAEVGGETDAATARVSPVPPAPSPPDETAPGTEPPTPLAQAQDALRKEVLGRLRADNFDWLEGIRLLQDVNGAADLDSLCALYNRLAHIERMKERARRQDRRRQRFGLVGAGAAAPGQAEATAPVFALAEKTGLDADAVEDEIKRYLGPRYQRFVSQAVNDMEFGRGKPTPGYPGLRHASAGIAGMGSCSVFYYQDAERNRVRVAGIGHHAGSAAYRLDYAAEELRGVGHILHIA